MWAFPAHQVRSILFANMLPASLSVPHVSMDMLSNIPSMDILSHIPGIEDVTSKPPQEKVTNNLRAREEASINLRNAGLALDTCDGAMQRLEAFFQACPPTMVNGTTGNYGVYSASSCGNAECAAAISSFDDAALIQMKDGFTACGTLPAGNPMKGYGFYADMPWALMLNDRVTQCGLPAGTVKLPTPPAPHTCDGAMQRLVALDMACPGTMLPGALVDGKRIYSPSSCGNAVCAEAISSFDDAALSLMRTGFTACGALPAGNPMKKYGMYADMSLAPMLNARVMECGLPAGTVRLTPPALYTCDGAFQRLGAFIQACSCGTGSGTGSGSGSGTACVASLNSIDDMTLSLMKAGFTACGALPAGHPMKAYGIYEDYIDMMLMSSPAACGLPASTVKLTPPAPDTCQGAIASFTAIPQACSCGTGSGTGSGTGKGTACATLLNSIDDMTLSLMKAGFTACGALPAGHPMKEFGMYKDRMNTHDASEYLLQFARDCGLPASTLKLTQETACSGTLVHPSWVLAPAECVAPAYNKMGKINVVLGSVNNCLEEHTSSTVVFHPGFQLATGGSNAAMIKLETPSKHPPVQLYHTGTVFIKYYTRTHIHIYKYYYNIYIYMYVCIYILIYRERDTLTFIYVKSALQILLQYSSLYS
jgi:hypothetical protein